MANITSTGKYWYKSNPPNTSQTELVWSTNGSQIWRVPPWPSNPIGLTAYQSSANGTKTGGEAEIVSYTENNGFIRELFLALPHSQNGSWNTPTHITIVDAPKVIEETDTFLVNGSPQIYTSPGTYSSRQPGAQGDHQVKLNFAVGVWFNPKFPNPWRTDIFCYNSDGAGNRDYSGGYSPSVVQVAFNNSDNSVRSFTATDTGSYTNWSTTGYVTYGWTDFEVSNKVQAKNLKNANLADCIVLVNEGDKSYQCKIKDLPSKARDDRYMLINRGDQSFKVKTTLVVSECL